eukprot:9277620-Ditylum_brightwellii.AAC.1
MPRQKKNRRGYAYSVDAEHFIASNVSVVLPVSEVGWETVHNMHNAVYSQKQRIIESIMMCFEMMQRVQISSGDPDMPLEIGEPKMAWLQIQTKSECSTGSSDEDVSGS